MGTDPSSSKPESIQDQNQGPVEITGVRLVWNPEKSSHVDAIIAKVVEKYEKGEFKVVINPAMLCSMGVFESRFCGQAFRRKNRAEWVEERFPNGFASFVAEVNQALEKKGLAVVGNKRELPDYVKLQQPHLPLVQPNYSNSSRPLTVELHTLVTPWYRATICRLVLLCCFNLLR